MELTTGGGWQHHSTVSLSAKWQFCETMVLISQQLYCECYYFPRDNYVTNKKLRHAVNSLELIKQGWETKDHPSLLRIQVIDAKVKEHVEKIPLPSNSWCSCIKMTTASIMCQNYKPYLIRSHQTTSRS